MKQHPERDKLLHRLSSALDDLTITLSGDVFRFVDPKYCSVEEMFAGNGPYYADGRWLIRSRVRATYTSLVPETALAEALSANRYYGFPDSKSTPLVFVSAKAKLQNVIDLRDGMVRKRLRTSIAAIIDTDWRKENQGGKEAITQAWGWAFQKAGLEAILCPSASTKGGSNLIVFPENLKKGSQLKVTREVEWPRI